jgi:hypothetical protein
MPRGPRSVTEAATDRLVGWLDRVAEDGLVFIGVRRVQRWFGHGRVQAKLLPGEDRRWEVMHSGVYYIRGVVSLLIGLFLLVRWVPFVSVQAVWFAVAITAVFIGYGFYRILWVARDRFVITDSRVFRVWGVESLHEAEMEIGRVLDITVDRPWWLRPFKSGHLVLENAAQQQGLRDIRYVPRPEDLAREIHRLRREATARAGTSAPSGASPRRHADHPAQRRPTARRRPH